MPIYEYQCQSCGERTEALQKMNDPALETCKTCEGPLKRLISAPAVQFKGTGWYVTDYAGKKGEKKESASDSSSKSADSGTKSSESSSKGSESSSGSSTAKSDGKSSSSKKPETKGS